MPRASFVRPADRHAPDDTRIPRQELTHKHGSLPLSFPPYPRAMPDARTKTRAKEAGDPKDPLLRSLILLSLIPRYPKSTTVQELRDALEKRGFAITTRTLQRDLGDKLSRRFPLICQEDGQTFRWSFDSQAQINLPATDTAAALAMHLAEGHLRHLLPPGVVDLLEPQFAEARHHLQGLEHNHLKRWAQREAGDGNVQDDRRCGGVWLCVAGVGDISEEVAFAADG